MKFFETLSFWLWENLNFPVWTYSVISPCYYKCNKRNLHWLRLCYAEYEIIFYLQNILLPVLMFWPFSVTDGGSCSQLYQSRLKLSVDAWQPLLIESEYSMMFSMHCLQINVCKSVRFRCSPVLWVSGINRELFLYFDFRRVVSL